MKTDEVFGEMKYEADEQNWPRDVMLIVKAGPWVHGEQLYYSVYFRMLEIFSYKKLGVQLKITY